MISWIHRVSRTEVNFFVFDLIELITWNFPPDLRIAVISRERERERERRNLVHRLFNEHPPIPREDVNYTLIRSMVGDTDADEI